MSRLLNYFFKGLIVLAPLAVTVYVVYIVFTRIDGWLGLPWPGAGFLATILLITLFGWLASTIIARSLFGALESLLNRLPFVRLLYSSTSDLLNAFVGEKRRFDKPVLVTVNPAANAKAFGFVTQESLQNLGMVHEVAVYLPFSYSIAGALYVFPADQVKPVDADAAGVMAFIVSGGVTRIPEKG